MEVRTTDPATDIRVDAPELIAYAISVLAGHPESASEPLRVERPIWPRPTIK
jgi:hypothetical protein